MNFVLNDKQTEKLADLLIDLGKLSFGSLVLGFFQSSLGVWAIFAYGLLGLLMSAGFCILGLKLFRETK